MWFIDSCATELLVLFITSLVVIIGYYKWIYQYWERRNLPYLAPKIPFSNLGTFFEGKEHSSIRIKRAYDTMKNKGWKHGGIFGVLAPIYLPIDLEYLKNIMTKDFQYFTSRGTYYNEEGDPITAHLFNIDGAKWRNLRTKLTPTFTSGKMRAMFETLIQCETNLQKTIQMEIGKGAPIDIKELLACFTTDVIGSCAFGLDCRAFEQENSPFRFYGKKIFDRNLLATMKFNFLNAFPNFSRKLNLRLAPREVSSFFMKLVKDTVKYREANNIKREDFMQLLINMKNNLGSEEGYKNDGTTLTVEEIAAQSFVFFIAGFETSSTTMTFTLYELARNQDIQDTVRDEINSVLAKYDGKITYKGVQEMKYMNQVVDESLRMYPPAPIMLRKCDKDYKVPETNVILEKDTRVLIPILAIHYDKEYYPDPEKFDPDRFNEKNKALRHSYAHIPFGEGPRICIGMRFGLMQTKVGLASLLKDFKFTVNEKTKEPLKMKPNSLVLAAEGEIWLSAQKI